MTRGRKTLKQNFKSMGLFCIPPRKQDEMDNMEATTTDVNRGRKLKEDQFAY